MPKKRNPNFKSLQGPSSPSNPPKPTDNGPSVNDRLSELRKQEGRDAAAKKRELADSVNQRSVPPELEAILGVPESEAPKAKGRIRARERWRTPGPAPPRSWGKGAGGVAGVVLRGVGGGRGKKGKANVGERRRSKQLLRFAKTAGLEREGAAGGPPTLLHLTLKTIAECWDGFDEEDYPALVEIPLRVRLRLVSYIDYYGPGIDAAALEALLQADESIRLLDLSGLIGHGNLTLKRITKMIEKDSTPTTTTTEPDSTPDSWDAADALTTTLTLTPSNPRFAHLTHLSLAHPPATVLWRDLLSLTKQTPHLTHLSLAAWPRPTLTPNLTTSTVTSAQGTEISAGGSNLYSALDADNAEPRSLLRQLSANLLCLQFLDLEACESWTPALSPERQSSATGAAAYETRWLPSESSSRGSLASSPFLTTWSNLTRLRLAQGWLPSLAGVRACARLQLETPIQSALEQYLVREGGVEAEVMADAVASDADALLREKRSAAMWLENEARLAEVAARLAAARRATRGKRVEVDMRWRVL